VQVRFLLGPAGSGKTFRCLAEIRRALLASPAGPPLLLIAPKQTTYQLERQLLAHPSLPAYTRLQILSFERLAHFIFDQLHKAPPKMLDEEGRLMVLRGLLSKRRKDLKLFRASARLTGFAQQLSLALSELQRSGLTPDSLNLLATQVDQVEGLSYKLEDLATLLQEYLNWLAAHGLQDADSLLPAATLALKPEETRHNRVKAELSSDSAPCPSNLWVDGFAEFSEQELDLLAAVVRRSEKATLTFCLDQAPNRQDSWLSNWSVVRRNFERCRQKLGATSQTNLAIEILPRAPDKTRFTKNPVLQHLEARWADPGAYPGSGRSGDQTSISERHAFDVSGSLQLIICADPEAEVALAAREILRHVRAGGRYRDVTVLVRKLEGYHHAVKRVFSRYGVPFFLDRRESLAHHPLAELTRSALRTVTFQWLPDDWFAALKTGLAPATENEVDRLENEALARGWRGSVWQKPIVLKDDPELTEWLADLRGRLVPPFHKLALDLARSQNNPTGLELASALRRFWAELHVEQTLRDWAGSETLASDLPIARPVHATVWTEMNAWLANVELAFPNDPLSLREWLPILEAGLSNLAVGVIPPALDQVLVGSIDRSRNPDIKLALVLGLNETVFPSAPNTNVLLTETERAELGRLNSALPPAAQRHLSREHYLAYVACTRARERLVLTCARADTHGTPLNPSPFLSHVRQLFPSLRVETQPESRDWRESEHVNELIGPLLRIRKNLCASETTEQKLQITDHGPQTTDYLQPTGAPPEITASFPNLERLPSVSAILKQLQHLTTPAGDERLEPELAAKLYGPVLRTSVSRMEQFAACPFKFFVHSGMRAQERQVFELDVKEQGTFQHDVLAMFHEQLRAEQLRWRDVTPAQARERIAAIAKGLMASYREGLLEASEETRFMARLMMESLQDFVETLVGWMRDQYQFDPVAVELPFGEGERAPAWTIDLGTGRRLELYGRVDRIDLCQADEGDGALCVVVDYKSSQKQLDPLLVEHGLQLQLLTYLNVVRRWPNPQQVFGFPRLIPAGVFYVNLRGKYERAPNRLAALTNPQQARKFAYRHAGRFDVRSLRHLDSRPDAREGDQFNYRLTNDGFIYKNSREAMSTAEFQALLQSVESNLKRTGRLVYSGRAEVAPYKKGATTACDQCGYWSICRIDPWSHLYRILRKESPDEGL